ncbi:MFS transporter [Pyrenochaeta sp. DS3sAY3a]|nr:MFS transporter [Pyrenochaeta sp. DS3sAY3a]
MSAKATLMDADIKKIDQAALFLAEAEDYVPLTPKQQKRLKRKIDFIVVPMLFLTATLGAVDKVALSTAAIYGLREDNKLVGQQYSWLGSMLSLGALVGMFPSSYLIHRFPAAKYLCSCSIGWSLMALLMPACHNYGGLLTLRFLMGALEAIIVPGISLLIAGWYKKNEQPPRNAIVFAAMSSVVNGFLSWAVGHIPDSAPLAKWQYLYLIVGSISMSWSIFALFFLPDNPMNAFFLTKDEKTFWIRRLAENKTGIVNNVWKLDQAIEAVADPKTWIIFFFNIAINIPNGGLTTFNAIIIKNLGFTSVQSSLLAMPTGVMSTIASIVFSVAAAKWNNRRCLVCMMACVVPITGTAVLYGVARNAVAAQLVGLYLCYTYFGPYVVGISLAQANTAGHTKKNVQFSILYIGYAVGNLIGPQTFRASQAPAYTGGVIAMLVCYCVCIGLMATYWFLCVVLNRKVVPAHVPEGDAGAAVESFKDITDFKQEGFRYTT